MTRFLIAVVIIFSLLSCNNNTGPSGGNAGTDKVKISGRCAVFYTPGGARLHQLKKEFGEKSFQGIEAVNLQYMKEAGEFLTKEKVKIIATSAYQLNFVKGNGEVVSIDLNRSKYAWEIFLFNGFDDPVKIDMTNVEEAYRDAKMSN